MPAALVENFEAVTDKGQEWNGKMIEGILHLKKIKTDLDKP